MVSPSLSTVGSPALLMVLRSGRGYDARNGAKSQQDKDGRLKFQFQSFVSFNSARRYYVEPDACLPTLSLEE